MQALEAVYNGRVFIPTAPVPLEKNQRVILTFSRKLEPAEGGDEYPEGFFDLWGALKDACLERPPQGNFSDDCRREPL